MGLRKAGENVLSLSLCAADGGKGNLGVLKEVGDQPEGEVAPHGVMLTPEGSEANVLGFSAACSYRLAQQVLCVNVGV